MDRPRAERDTIINFATRSATRPISAVPIKHHFRREIPVCKFLHTVRQPVVMVAHVIDRRVMVCAAQVPLCRRNLVIGRLQLPGGGKGFRPARRWKSLMPTFGPSGAKPKPLSPGTEGSNPALSSGKSANFWSLSGGNPPAAPR